MSPHFFNCWFYHSVTGTFTRLTFRLFPFLRSGSQCCDLTQRDVFRPWRSFFPPDLSGPSFFFFLRLTSYIIVWSWVISLLIFTLFTSVSNQETFILFVDRSLSFTPPHTLLPLSLCLFCVYSSNNLCFFPCIEVFFLNSLSRDYLNMVFHTFESI